MQKQNSSSAPREPRAYEEPTIVAIGALHELTLGKTGPGADHSSHYDFPSGTS